MKILCILFVFSILCFNTVLIAQSDNGETKDWQDTPADVQKVFTRNDTTFLVIDILSHNPKFKMEDYDSYEPVYLNQSTKLRTVALTKTTHFYDCDNNKPTKEGSRSQWLAWMEKGIKEALKYPEPDAHHKEGRQPRLANPFYFNIKNGEVTAVYQPCLP
jgi:hypothetical protein